MDVRNLYQNPLENCSRLNRSVSRRKGDSGYGIEALSDDGSIVRLPADDKAFESHCLVVGNTRFGKSNLVFQMVDGLIGQDPTSQFIFLDAKGDYINRYSRFGKGKILSFNIEESREFGVSAFNWNVFQEARSRGDPSIAFKGTIASLFKREIAKSSHPFFPEACKNILTEVGKALIRLEKSKTADLISYTNPEFINLLSQKVPSIQPYIEAKVTFSNVMATMNNFLQEYFENPIMANTGDDTIWSFLSDKTLRFLYLRLSPENRDVSGTIFASILENAIQAKLSMNNPRRKLYLILDEMPLLGHDSALDTACHLGSAYGVRLIAGFQNLNQVYRLFTGSDSIQSGKALLAGFGSHYFFNTTDPDTAAYASSLIGEEDRLKTFLGPSRRESAYTSVVRERKVTEEDLASLQIGECYCVLKDGFYKVKLRKV